MNPPKHGFREYVNNPELFRQEVREMQAAATAGPPEADELVKLVAEIGRRSLDYAEIAKLTRAGEQIVPLLLAALRDFDFVCHPYAQSGFYSSALQAVLRLLEPFRLPEASVLQPILERADEKLRKVALAHLALCGNDDAIDALLAGLKSPDEYTRSYILGGLGGHGSKRFRAVMFDAVVRLLADPDFNPAHTAPRTLLALDLDRAKSLLLGDEIFNSENPNIKYILEALRDKNLPVPAPQLRALLAGLKSRAADYPFDWAYSAGLILLARAEKSGAADVLHDALTWGNEEVREGAAKGLEIAAEVGDPFNLVMGLYGAHGVAALTEPQLFYLTAWLLDADVRNGGFDQYFFNSSGDLARHAVAAVHAVGGRELAEIVSKAVAAFGKKGPHPDRDKRMDQLSQIDRKFFDELNSAYYKCSESLRELLPRYVASHADAFRGRE